MEENTMRELSSRFQVNAEEGTGGAFPVFLRHVEEKRVAVIADRNTAPLFSPLKGEMEKVCDALLFVFEEEEPVADERSAEQVRSFAEHCGYVLAVGSGTMNDLAKAAGAKLNIPCGVLATAPSMDGYTSGVSALIEGGKKVSYPTQIPADVLIDPAVLASAPERMIGAGVGDILAKDCSLADWALAHSLVGEAYNEEAAFMMRSALNECKAGIPALLKGEKRGMRKLMDALLVSGYAMIKAGSSRPASGAEHHMSHFLEMDFLRRGERIPLHGVKVGLGTALSQELYREAAEEGLGGETVSRIAGTLPKPRETLDLLKKFGCPTRFGELGISRETFRAMLKEAYLLRERLTILRLFNERGWMTDARISVLEEKFF